ncbi:MAG: creatinine amidohydrolase, partial [Peptostreptococcaceae bacterium]|nr:creatinine amidohydrolase [Peptostreptococcaceae bacterium]
SGSIGYYFKEKGDHMSTTAVPDEETRNRLANEGAELIEQMVERMNLTHVVEQMRKLEEYNKEVEEKCPWVPSNFNKNRF